MNSRERLLTSLNHVEPDRVPLFHPNMIHTYEPYDSGLLAFLGQFAFDELTNVSAYVDAPGGHHVLEDGSIVDGFGCRFEYKGVGMPYCTHSPLAGAETVADVTAHRWPDPTADRFVDSSVVERAQQLHSRGDRVLSVGMAPLFHQYHYLRGFEQWMIDVKLHRDLHQAIAERIYEVNVTLLMRALALVGPYIDVVETGDDFGTSLNSYWSPADFRTLIKPFYADLIERIKRHYPHVKFYLHSHGQIMDLVPDLIECGVDVLNPILPLDGMDAARLKRDFGDALCFHGGVDIERIVPFGSRAEVEDHVNQVIDTLAPGGGYWFKLQAISPVCPPENVVAAYKVAADYGAYAQPERAGRG